MIEYFIEDRQHRCTPAMLLPRAWGATAGCWFYYSAVVVKDAPCNVMLAASGSSAFTNSVEPT